MLRKAIIGRVVSIPTRFNDMPATTSAYCIWGNSSVSGFVNFPKFCFVTIHNENTYVIPVFLGNSFGGKHFQYQVEHECSLVCDKSTHFLKHFSFDSFPTKEIYGGSFWFLPFVQSIITTSGNDLKRSNSYSITHSQAISNFFLSVNFREYHWLNKK